MVKSGEVDFGFGSIQASDPDLEFTPLFRDRMHAIFLPGCVLEQRKSAALASVTEFPLILMSRDSTVRTVVDRGLAAIGHFAPPAHEASYISTALGMVRAGLGVTILPSSVLDIGGGAGLVSRPVIRPGIDRDVGLICRRGRSPSPAAESFQLAIRRRTRAARP
jgi:DNA-binding transcriptional LysR family regulator